MRGLRAERQQLLLLLLLLRLLGAKLRDTPRQRTQVGPTTLRASAVGLRPTEGGSRRRGGAEQLLLAPDLAASVAQRVAADRPVGTLPVAAELERLLSITQCAARPKRCETLELDPPATSPADHGTVAAPTLSSMQKAARHLSRWVPLIWWERLPYNWSAPMLEVGLAFFLGECWRSMS